MFSHICVILKRQKSRRGPLLLPYYKAIGRQFVGLERERRMRRGVKSE
jgi:hypothetical protein